MTVGDLRHFERHLSPGRKEYSRRWIDSIEKAFSRYQAGVVYGYKKWITAPLYESANCKYDENIVEVRESRRPSGDTAVNVNIALPDSVLLEDFKNWLSEIRKQQWPENQPKRYRRPDFQEWVRFGVLPFLDLTIWARETGVSIPNRVMADAIFELWDSDAETVRKTVAPLAMSLISEPLDGSISWLSLLAANAGREIQDYPEAKTD